MIYKLLLKTTEDSWQISHGAYGLNQQDYKIIHRAWSSTFKDIIRPQMRVLIINGADQVTKNALACALDITIVDPHAYTLCEPEYQEILSTESFKATVDICGYSHKLTLLDDTFLYAIEDGAFKSKFDVIIIANSYEDNFADVTSKRFLEHCYFYLKEYGCLCIQAPQSFYNNNTDFRLTLDYYFSEIGKKLRFLTSYNQDVALTIYRKFSNLV
jgi:hypothetical protein